METRINKKITFYTNDFKEGIINQFNVMKDSTLPINDQYETNFIYKKL